MSSEVQSQERMTIDEYFEFEKDADERHEFIHGQVVAMAGASDNHELVAGNIFAEMHRHLRGKGCRVYKGDMKLKIALGRDDLIYYPDVMVTCDQSDDASTFKKMPNLLVEVSSDFNRDHLEKRFVYQQIDSLEEYLVVEQSPENQKARVYRKSNGWEPDYLEAGDDIVLDSIGLTLSLADLYVS